MPTQQPEWEYIGNLGDESPLDHGGLFIYRDKTGVYEEEAALLVVDDEDDPKSRYTIYRFVLERLKLVDGVLVPFRYQSTWGTGRLKDGPFEWMPDSAPKKYEEWFVEELPMVAESIGAPLDELLEAFTSADPKRRAFAYEALGQHHGFENLDSYPLKLTRAEAKKRYRDELKQDEKSPSMSGLRDVPLPPDVPRPEMWTTASIVQAVRDGFTFMIPFVMGKSLFSPNAYWIAGRQAAASGFTVGPEHTPDITLIEPDDWIVARTYFQPEMVPGKAWLAPPNEDGVVPVNVEIDPETIDWDLLNRGHQIRTRRV